MEATFGKLKEQAYLVTSFPRPVEGYFVHYIRVLLGYQMKVNSRFGLVPIYEYKPGFLNRKMTGLLFVEVIV